MAEEQNPVYDIRYTTVVPGRVAGEGKAHELTAMDLAMKLHNIRGVYFFSSAAVQGMQANDFKKPMFQWLIPYSSACGRIRISETGRPFVKLNDAGVRIIEARCSKTIDEWLAMKDCSLDDKLVCVDALGDELSFTPLVYIQVTCFKCGGISMGLSWAHVLGDVFSASAFMNGLTQFLHDDQHPLQDLQMPDPTEPHCSRSIAAKARSLKRVDPVGNTWITTTNPKMAKYTFHFTSKQLDYVNSCMIKVPDPRVRSFELVSAIIWKSIAKIRKNSMEPKIVTICKNKKISNDRENMIPYNGLEVGIVEVKFSLVEADVTKLATSIVEEMAEENGQIEEIVEEELGETQNSDYVVYGAKLTFLDMEEANIYGLKVNGESPIFVNYNISAVSDEGAVLVYLGPEFGKEKCNDGKLATAILPKNELEELRNMLKQEWGII